MNATVRAVSVLLAAAAAGLSGCTRGNVDRVHGDDMLILGALLRTACDFEYDRIIISDQPADFIDHARGTKPPRSFLADSYPERNSTSRTRWPTTKICSAARVVPDAAIEAALARETTNPPDWRAVKAAFEDARTIMRVSLPVYSEDGKQAVVYTTNACPFTCGSGFYHELAKVHGGWRVENSVVAWTL